MRIIAVDFDGTLCESAWPDIGKAHWGVINQLVKRQAEGDKIILWTCRTGDQLDEAVKWCVNHGIRFDRVNENMPEMIEKYGSDTRKVFAHEYWDDKAAVFYRDGVSWHKITVDQGYRLAADSDEDVKRDTFIDRIRKKVGSWRFG